MVATHLYSEDTAVSRTNPLPIDLPTDAAAGALLVVLATLSATPYVVKVCTLPDWVRGVRLTPSADVLFAVGEAPVAVATHPAGDNTLVAADFSVGNVAAQDLPEVRQIPTGTGRTLQLCSQTASADVQIELF